MNALKRIKSRGYTLKEDYKRAYKEQAIELIDSKRLAKDQATLIRILIKDSKWLQADHKNLKADYSTLITMRDEEVKQDHDTARLKKLIGGVIIWMTGMILGMLI